MDSCEGIGHCLEQTGIFDEEGIEEYKKREHYDCSHNCIPLRCSNFQICNTVAPVWYYLTHKGKCFNCYTEKL